MNEYKVHWFRRSNLPWCRVVDLPQMAEVHKWSLEFCEILGITLSADMRPMRAFYISHRQPDGFGPFVPDMYHGRPVAMRSAQHNSSGDPPSFSTMPDKRTAAIEARLRSEAVTYWADWQKAHAPTPAPKKKWSLFR